MIFELLVGEGLAVIRVVSLPNDGNVISAFRQMPVNAVHGDIQFCAHEPACGAGTQVGL